MRDEAARQEESSFARRLRRKPAAGAKSGASACRRNGATLAERIVTAPHLVEPKAGARARGRMAGRLAGGRGQAAQSAARRPSHRQHAAGKPGRKLALSVGTGERRTRIACCGCLGADPDRHLAALLAETRPRRRRDRGRDAEAMRLLRRMKAEAALLIALADIGGVWPVMRATRALTDLGRYRGRCRRPLRAGRCRARRPPHARKTKRSRRSAAATSCWPWARWARSSSIIRAISISSCSTIRRRRPCRRMPRRPRCSCG